MVLPKEYTCTFAQFTTMQEKQFLGRDHQIQMEIFFFQIEAKSSLRALSICQNLPASSIILQTDAPIWMAVCMPLF